MRRVVREWPPGEKQTSQVVSPNRQDAEEDAAVSNPARRCVRELPQNASPNRLNADDSPPVVGGMGAGLEGMSQR